MKAGILAQLTAVTLAIGRLHSFGMTAPARLPQAEWKRIFAAAKQAGVFVAVAPDGRVEMMDRAAKSENDNGPVELD